MKPLSGIMLTLLLLGVLTRAFVSQTADAAGTIYIRADGSVEPPTAPISSVDSVVYTLTDNIYVDFAEMAIVVERDNIIVDGANHTVGGEVDLFSGNVGVYLSGISNVTIRNLNIDGFWYGIYLVDSSNNSIYGNTNLISPRSIELHNSSNTIMFGNRGRMIRILFSSNHNSIFENNVGTIWLHNSSNNNIFENNITNPFAIVLGASSNSLYHNSFVETTHQVELIAPSINVWDDGYPSGGNYWSNGTHIDVNGDGIADASYTIDADNKDRYPLMSPYWYWSNPIVGDLNRDMRVDVRDIVIVAMAYGTYPGHARWNPNADVAGPSGVPDNKVDIRDITLVATNFGKTYP